MTSRDRPLIWIGRQLVTMLRGTGWTATELAIGEALIAEARQEAINDGDTRG